MELIKWQTVLTEWINCLNIVTPIRVLQDLRDQELLKKLVLELSESNLNPENVTPGACISAFLKKHFPGYKFEVESLYNDDLLEITYICSLLLYYCCVIHCRAEFINVLCTNLSIPSQIHVKYFLEDLELRKEFTKESLKFSISTSTQKYSSTPPKCMSPYNSPKHSRESSSFLQDYLRTPVKKYQRCIEQHKKEIQILSDKLDLEILEKNDLQEELKAQYEINKRLESKISTKTKEVSRLRAELLTLESERASTDVKTEGQVENKRLRNEISSLEKYVVILNQEQDELRAERDSAREKLSRVEEQCKEWQGKALEAEHQCSDLSFELQKQQNELLSLHEHAEELSRMLKELRPRRSMDESYEMDSSQSDIITHNRSAGIIDYDNLAHTVVDVQLLESQQENSNLKKQLHEAKDVIINQDIKIQDLTRSYESTEHSLKETLQKNVDLTKTIEFSKNEFSDLELKFLHTDKTLIETQAENEKLYSELKTALGKCTNFVTELNDLNKKHQTLMLEKNTLETKLGESIKELQEIKNANETYKNNTNKFNSNLQNCLVKIESLIAYKNPIKGKDNFDIFNNMLEQIESKIKEDLNKNKALQEERNKLKQECISLQNEFKEKEMQMSVDIEKLKNSLRESENKVDILENSLSSLKTLVDEQKSILVNQNEVIEKQNIELSEKETKINYYENKIEQLSKQVEQLQNEVLNEQKTNEKLEKTSSIMKAKFETEINYLSDKIKEKTDHAENLQKLIDETAAIILEDLNSFSDGNIKSYVTTLKSQYKHSSSEEKRLSNEMEVLKEDLAAFYNILENYKNNIIAKIVESNKNLSELFQNMQQISNDEELTDKSITIKNKYLLNVVNHIININQKFKYLGNNITHVIKDKNLSMEQIEVLRKEKSTLTTNLRKQEELLNDFKTELVNKTKQIESEEKEHQLKLQRLEQDLNSCVKLKEESASKVIELTKEREAWKTELKHFLTRKENQSEEFLAEMSSFAEVKSAVIRKLKQNENDIQQYQKKVQHLQEEITKLQKLSKDSAAKVIELTKIIQDLEKQKSNLLGAMEQQSQNFRKQEELLTQVRNELAEKTKQFENEEKEHQLKVKHLEEDLNVYFKLTEESAFAVIELTKEKETLEAERKHLLSCTERQVQNFRAQLVAFGEVKNALADKTKEHENDAKQHQEKVQQLEEEITKLQKSSDESAAKIIQLTQQIDDLQTQKSALLKEIEQQGENFRKQEEKLTEVEKELADKTKKLETEEKEHQEQVKRLEQDVNSYFNLTEETAFKVIQLTQETEALQAEKKHLLACMETQVENFRAQLASFGEVKNALSDKTKEHERDVEKYQEKVQHLEEEITKLQKLSEESDAKIIELTQLTEDLQSQKMNQEELLIEVKNNLSHKTTQYENEVKQHQEKILQLQEEITSLKNEIVDLTAKENHFKSEFSSLQQKFDKSLVDYSHSLEKITNQYEEKISSSDKSHEEQVASVQVSFNTIISNLEESITKYKTSIKASENVVETLQKENKNLLNELRQTQSELTETKKEFQSLQNHLQEATKNLNKLLKQEDTQIEYTNLKDALNKIVKDCCKQHESNNNKIKILENIKEELEKQFEESLHKIENLQKENQSQVENQKDSIQALMNQNSELEKSLKDSESREKATATELNFLRSELEKSKTNSSESEKLLNTVKKTYEEQIKNLQEEIDSQKTNIIEIENTKEDLISESNDRKRQLEILTEEKDTLKSDLENVLKDLNESNKLIEDLKEELNLAKSDETHFKEQVSTLETQLTELKESGANEVANLKKKIATLVKDKEFLQNVYEEYVRSTDTKLSSLQTEQEEYNTKIESLSKELDTYKAMACSLESSESTAKSLIDEKNVTIQKLTTDKNEINEKLEAMTQLYNDLDKLFKQTNQEISETKLNFEEKEKQLNCEIEENQKLFKYVCENITSALTSDQIVSLEEYSDKIFEVNDTLNIEYNSSNAIEETLIYLKKQIISVLNEKSKHYKQEKTDLKKKQEVIERDLYKTNLFVEEKLQEISKLKEQYEFTTNEIKSMKLLNNNLVKSLKDTHLELKNVMQELNELRKLHENTGEENKQNIESMKHALKCSTTYLEKKLEEMSKEKEQEYEERKRCENLLTTERNNISELTENNKKLSELCSIIVSYIHNINKMTLNEEISNSFIEMRPEQLLEEKDSVDEEYCLISNQILKLKQDLTSYIALQENYRALLAEKEAISKNQQNGAVSFQNQLENLQAQLTKMTQRNEELIQKEQELVSLEKTNNEYESKIEVLERKLKDYETLLIENQFDYQNLKKRHNEVSDLNSNLKNQVFASEQKLTHLQKLVEDVEEEYQKLTKRYDDLSEKYKFLVDKCSAENENAEKQENIRLRTAYSNLMADQSRLQLECSILRKTIDERNSQLGDMSLVKESYEKLLEENNKLVTELDTLRYKKSRDKDDFKKKMEEEKNKLTTAAEAKLQIVRNEYEDKLRQMKEKIVWDFLQYLSREITELVVIIDEIKLYKTEVDKEKRKIATEQQEYAKLEEVNASLKSQLWMTSNKFAELKKEYEKLQIQMESNSQLSQSVSLRRDEMYSSRESVASLQERKAVRECSERRLATLPRDAKLASSAPVKVEETVTMVRRRSITTQGNMESGLKMEDEEGEIFNNVYLADLKAGVCGAPMANSTVRDSMCRLSELQYRNSLCPPHLKSSYPAETQFNSPSQFKEDDIKSGHIDMDDSMSSSLLPTDKPRTKKDWGQTLYKKPGPPTPSKNGGRLSLQGNEVHPRDVLRDHNENAKQQTSRTSSTPNRIKALFSAKSSSQRSESENQASPTKRKGRNIFRLHR